MGAPSNADKHFRFASCKGRSVADGTSLLPHCGLGPGSLVEVEWTPGRWRVGNICDVLTDDRVTVRYNDGLLWLVTAQNMRPIAAKVSRRNGVDACSVPSSPKKLQGLSALVPLHRLALESDEVCSQASLTESTRASEGCDGMEPDGNSDTEDEVQEPDVCKKQPSASNASMCSDSDANGGSNKLMSKLFEDRSRSSQSSVVLQPKLAYAEWNKSQDRDVRDARDAILTLEARTCQWHAEVAAERAVLSEDWWQLQAAMQLVASVGLADKWASRLQAAMRSLKQCDEAACEAQMVVGRHGQRSPADSAAVVPLASSTCVLTLGQLAVKPRILRRCCCPSLPPSWAPRKTLVSL